jgi:hypothetical protein
MYYIPDKELNVGKILKINRIFLKIFFLFTSWNLEISRCDKQ